MKFSNSLKLYSAAVDYIPMGTSTFSRNPNLFVIGASPLYISHAKGSRIYDVDGNEFIDFLCGYGPIILGYREKEVDEAVFEQVRKKGFCFTLTQKFQNLLAAKLA